MGLFDSVRGFLGNEESADTSDDLSVETTGETPRLDVRDPTPMDFRNKAVDAVQEWDDCELDYTLESLERLDSFARKQGARLDVLREQSDDGGERIADMHTGFTIRAGSYLGEVLVREVDGEWVEEGDAWAVMVPTGDDAQTVDVFDVASHSFAQEPVFSDLAGKLGADLGADEADEAEAEDIDLRPDFRPDAEEFAAFWNEYGLDFSPISLARLDVLVESEWDDDEFDDVEAGDEDMDSKMYTELIKQLGCYYGEVLVRELDASWTRRSGAVVVVVPGAADTAEVTVSVFDVAEAALTDRKQFATAIATVAEQANLEAPSVPTRASSAPAPDEQLDEIPDDEPVEDESTTVAAEDQPDDDPPVVASEQESTGTAPDAAETAAETPAQTESDDGSDSTEGTDSVDDSDGAASTDSLSPAEIVGMDAAAETTAEESEPADTATTGRDAVATAEEAVDSPPATEAETDADAPADSPTAETPADEQTEQSEPAEGEATPQSTDGTVVDSIVGDGTESMDDAIPRAEANDGGTDSDSAAAADTGADEPAELDLETDVSADDDGVTAEEIREDAKAFAATWPGHELDFSPESLERLDALVGEEYATEDVPDVDLSAGNAADAGYLAARIVEAGGYFAEVLRRTVGGEWREDDDIGLVFVVSGQNGEALVDPTTVATDCFREQDSFAATYEAIRSQLSVSN